MYYVEYHFAVNLKKGVYLICDQIYIAVKNFAHQYVNNIANDGFIRNLELELEQLVIMKFPISIRQKKRDFNLARKKNYSICFQKTFRSKNTVYKRQKQSSFNSCHIHNAVDKFRQQLLKRIISTFENKTALKTHVLFTYYSIFNHLKFNKNLKALFILLRGPLYQCNIFLSIILTFNVQPI